MCVEASRCTPRLKLRLRTRETRRPRAIRATVASCVAPCESFGWRAGIQLGWSDPPTAGWLSPVSCSGEDCDDKHHIAPRVATQQSLSDQSLRGNAFTCGASIAHRDRCRLFRVDQLQLSKVAGDGHQRHRRGQVQLGSGGFGAQRGTNSSRSRARVSSSSTTGTGRSQIHSARVSNTARARG